MDTSPADDVGVEMHDLLTRLFPICRSITGDGLRETLRILGERIPLTIDEVPSGTPVLDWTVPREWNIRDAWVADSGGRRVIDFQRHNLHVMGYSIPVRAWMTLAELRPQQRAALLLNAIDGYTQAEIARMLGAPQPRGGKLAAPASTCPP